MTPEEQLAERRANERVYKIVRFYFKKPSRTIRSGVTLREAQQHCENPRTKRDGQWFDGYTRM